MRSFVDSHLFSARLEDVPLAMAINGRLTNFSAPQPQGRLYGSVCTCLADFFREEFIKHHQCLERQREYYSDGAISKAEEALARIMSQLEQLCQREDACQMVGEILRKFDTVTKLSAWTDSGKLH